MASFSELSRKKVGGVPVIYLAAAAVVILAVVAWRMKPTPDTTSDTGDTASDPSAGGGLNDPYSGLDSNGTVTVVQQPNSGTTPDDVVKTNEDWVREGAEWLTSKKGVSGSAANLALTKYVEGSDRTYQEATWVDLVIAEKGQPPESVSIGGTVGGPPSEPARKQFEPPGTHVVKGSSDNSLTKIAALYYGQGSGDNIDLLQVANPRFGTSTTGSISVGTSIAVPKWHAPVYWTVPTHMSWAHAASLQSLSEQQLHNLNSGPAGWRNAPALEKGRRIRVK